MTRTLLSVLIPAHNEAGNLRQTIDAIARTLTEASIPHEILVVDDHSTDGTVDVLEGRKSNHPSLRTLLNSRQQGFGNAVQSGLDEYRGDAVCIVPADGSDDPKAIVAYYQKLEEGYECAFGSRFVIDGRAVDYPLYKLILNRIAAFLIRLVFGLRYNDVTHPFKCYRRTAIDGVRPILSHYENIAAELPLKAIVRGYSYAVTPVTWQGRGGAKRYSGGTLSRYLFIVLVVLLEKLLAGGDYRRVSPPGEVTPAPHATTNRPSMLLPWLAFACVVAVHLLFVKTYPLNDLGGDTPGYYRLLVLRKSNLVHAPGYPFLAGLPLSIGPISDLVTRHPVAFRKALLFAQHAFDLLCLAILMAVLARAYNRLTAVVAVAIAGLSLQGMGVTSSVYPEWLQGDLLMLTISFALLAWRAATFRQKAFWYAIAFWALTWSYFVKFNTAVVFPVLILLMVCEKLPWRERARLIALAAAFAFLNYAAFVRLYHRPSTGTDDLSYDHSWVLMTRLEQTYGRLPYPQGIATKRWLAFAAMLPQTYEGASSGPFDNVNTVGPEIRAPYRGVAAEILAADEAKLDQILRSHPMPAIYNVALSSLPISWYVGLKVSDDLGVKVFFESIVHRPREFVASTARMSIAALRIPTAYPIVPVRSNTSTYCDQVIQQDDRHLRLVQSVNHSLPYRYSEPVIWSPGYTFFSSVNWISPASHRLLVALIILGFLAASMVIVLGGWSFRAATPLILTALLAGFVVFSNAMLEFRWKEMRFALPLVATLIGIAGGWTFPELIRMLTRAFRRRRSAAAVGQ